MKSFKKFLEERSLTPSEEKKKEAIKKAILNDPDFKKKYGKDAESRAFAIATSKAKEMNEEFVEELQEGSYANICTKYYMQAKQALDEIDLYLKQFKTAIENSDYEYTDFYPVKELATSLNNSADMIQISAERVEKRNKQTSGALNSTY